MSYKDDFVKLHSNIHYKTTNKMYYRTKAFKIGYFNKSTNLIKQVFELDSSKSRYNIFSYKPKPKYKHLFPKKETIDDFVTTIFSGKYVKTEQEVIAYLSKLKTIFDLWDQNCNTPQTKINICGPKDEEHLNLLKDLKSGKSTEINVIKLKEVLKAPTHDGYKYMLSGRYHFQSTPKSAKDLKDEIKSFIEMFGGDDNDNVMFTGSIRTILEVDERIMGNIYPARAILRGLSSMAFTVHYKDHAELMSLNFMKNNVTIVSAVEFMK